MKQLIGHHALKRMLQDGIAKGLWSLEDLDRPSPGFKLASESFSPQFGHSYQPPVWTNPLRNAGWTDEPNQLPDDF